MRLTHIVRRLLQLPVFTGIAVITLAIGIGANSGDLQRDRGLCLLKPLPYPNPDELVVLDHSAAGIGLNHAGAAPVPIFHLPGEDAAVRGHGDVATRHRECDRPR
jgi:hypothetical protein